MLNSTVAVLGAGSWGTAVGMHLARNGQRVLLWGHSPQHMQALSNDRQNKRYLPGAMFPDTLIPTDNLADCLKQATYLIIAVPSHAFAQLLTQISKKIHGLSWLTKGLDPNSQQLLSTLVADKWGSAFPIAVISGPSFAREVSEGLPTALVVAGNQPSYLNEIHSILHKDNLRVYLSNDYIGVQLAGAVKNVLAIACGVSDGLGLGANTKAALITRGLAEMRRLGVKLGAQTETFMGLSGVGDLVLTCTDNQSRNRRFGLLLGQGQSCNVAATNINQVVEGRHNATQVITLADNYKIEMPICQAVSDLLQEKLNATQAVEQLLSRPARNEL